MKKISFIVLVACASFFVSGKSFSMTPKETVNIINTYADVYAEVADLFFTRNIKRLKHPKDEIREAIVLMLPATEGEVCESLKILYVELDTFVDSEDWKGFSSGGLLKQAIGDVEKSAEAFLNEWPEKRSEVEMEIVLKQKQSSKELQQFGDCN